MRSGFHLSVLLCSPKTGRQTVYRYPPYTRIIPYKPEQCIFSSFPSSPPHLPLSSPFSASPRFPPLTETLSPRFADACRAENGCARDPRCLGWLCSGLGGPSDSSFAPAAVNSSLPLTLACASSPSTASLSA